MFRFLQLLLLIASLAQIYGQIGVVYMWGYNNYGQLGDGTTTQHNIPTEIQSPGKSFANLKLGTDHAGAITTDGELYMWGYNSNGQLGDGTQVTRYSPVAVSVPGKNFASLALGGTHSGAITIDRALYMWGYNSYGQLGDGTQNAHYLPIEITILGKSFATLALGRLHSGVITADGALYMWGYNGAGQLGDGTQIARYSPVAVNIPFRTCVTLALGGLHSGAITNDGALFMWGNNYYGQIGNGQHLSLSTPTEIIMVGKRFTTLGLGERHSGAITTGGELFMWGDNGFGQLGTTTAIVIPSDVPYPTVVPMPGKSFATLALGYWNTGATTTDGTVYIWGRNGYGQIGDGTSLDDRRTPTVITVPGKRVAALALGKYHSGALSIVSSSPSPNPSPSPASSSPSPNASPSPSPVSSSPSPNPSPSPNASPSPSPASSSPSPDPTPSPASPSRSTSRSVLPSRSPSRSVPPSRSPSRSGPPSRSPSRPASPSRSPSRSALPSPSPSLSPGEQCLVQQCNATALYWLANCGGCIHLGDTVPSPCKTDVGMATTSVEPSSSGRRNSQATVDVAVDGAITPSSSSSSTGSNVHYALGANLQLLIGFILGVGACILVQRMQALPGQSDRLAEAAP